MGSSLRVDCQVALHVALESDSAEACEIKVGKDRTVPGLAHDRTGFGKFGMLFTIVFNKMVIKWLVMAADAGGILADLVTVNANWECCSGSFGLQHSERLGGQDYLFSPSGAGDHVGTDTQADRAFFSTGKSDDAGREAASWKGTSCVRRRQHALFARLQNSSGSALRMALIWSHTYHSFQERATNEAEEVPSRSHKHNLWSNFGEPSARPEAAAGIEVARACASDQKRASHGTESHQLEASCDLRRLLREECWACRLALHPRSSWDKSRTSEEKH